MSADTDSSHDAESDAYVLGTEHAEIDRLHVQHAAWSEVTRAFWESGGVRPGQRVLDLGCGPGFCSVELATLVGSEGSVLAVDRSERFLARLEVERARLGLSQLELHLAEAQELELPAASLDRVYARWLFAWLVDPDPALACAAAALKPDGRLLLHEYLDWGTLRLLPAHSAFERVVQAALRGWADDRLHIDLAAELPERAPRVGLQLESLRPVARSGRPGSPVWNWVIGFLRSYIPKLRARALLGEAEAQAALQLLAEREHDPRTVLVAPLMGEAVLRSR